MFFPAQNLQSIRFFPSLLRGSLVLVLCLTCLTACGKRPSQVDPPLGGEKTLRVYPAPDPQEAL